MDPVTGAADVGELIAVERYLDRRARASEPPGRYGIALVTVSQLRNINREFGAAVGDTVLAMLATRLAGLAPDTCVARVGGDRFAVLIDGISRDDLPQFARLVRRTVNRGTFEVSGRTVPVHVRVTFRSGPSEHPRTDLLWAVEREERVEAGFELNERLKALEKVADLDGLLAERADLRTRLALAEQRARQDPLTTVLNRRGYEELLPSLRAPYAVAFVDVDNLRELNRAQGENWAAGDHALRGVARLLEGLGPDVVVVRWGGDEFLVLLPGLSADEAYDRLDALLAGAGSRLRAGDLPVTFSGGVDHAASAADHERAMRDAQTKTQEAKSAGRSQMRR